MLLTREQVVETLTALPAHRRDLRDALWNMLSLMKRGIEIQDTAPAWMQAQNVIFVNSIDKGEVEDETA